MINFIPNDPRSIDVLPMRRVAARPDRAADRAGFTVAGNAVQKPYRPGESGFVQWQARQAAILAVEAWEQVLDAPITSWAQESAKPKSLLLIIPDNGDEVNAYYDREALLFFHHKYRNGRQTFSGASTDVVAHETGHAILDAIRPDLFYTNLLEVGAFHESFGDVTAIVTALSDRKTRDTLLDVAPDLGAANFVESWGSDLAATVRRVGGAHHNASKPRHALNTFRWQLPETMSVTGGPNEMIREVHSVGRIMTGCFYDVLRAMFVASGKPNSNRLWSVTRSAAKLFHQAASTAPAVPRFFRSVGRAMVLADEALNDGANRELIGRAFFHHGLALGARSFLAPEIALAGRSLIIDRRAGAVTMEPTTMRDLRRRFGAPAGAAMTFRVAEMGNTRVADVAIRDEVSLDAVDHRVRGVVAAVDTVALVGESGGSPALLFAPRAGAVSSEVVDFVRSLVTHDQVTFDSPSTKTEEAPFLDAQPSATHAVARRGKKQQLQRIRFACPATGITNLGSER
jgi:hypothetical protein